VPGFCDFAQNDEGHEVVIFEFSDNGSGIPPAKLKAIRASISKNDIDDFPEPGLSGVALANIARRIRLRFGARYVIDVESDWGKGTTVTLRLPAITG
jgi:two-component system sensor histidine kinase YesM